MRELIIQYGWIWKHLLFADELKVEHTFENVWHAVSYSFSFDDEPSSFTAVRWCEGTTKCLVFSEQTFKNNMSG